MRSAEESRVLTMASQAYRDKVMNKTKRSVFRNRVVSRDSRALSIKHPLNPETMNTTQSLERYPEPTTIG